MRAGAKSQLYRPRGTQLPPSMLRLGRLAIVVLLAASLLAVPAWATVTHGANMWMWGSNERGQLGLGQMGTSWSDSVNQKVNTPTEGDTFWPGWIGKNVTKVDCVRARARGCGCVECACARLRTRYNVFLATAAPAGGQGGGDEDFLFKHLCVV